jgi:geranyl-CoA carboxylase alpha subunit
VTEAVTGLDLVELQLRVAAGEALPLSQPDVRYAGHAIEVRLCAEDAGKGFMPQSGTMALWKMPSRLRVEDAMRSGAEVSPFYDSMIAKLASHGRTRDEARRKLASGLEDAVALGVTTNQAFLLNCLRHPVFAGGGATTAFIAEHEEELLASDPDTTERGAALAAVLLQEANGTQGRLSHNLPIALRFELDGHALAAGMVRSREGRFEVSTREKTFDVELRTIGEDTVRFVCNGLLESAAYHCDGETLLIQYRGRAMRIEDKTRAASVRQDGAAGDGKLRASMNGRVVAVLAEIGKMVRAGDPLVTLEAMKMEHVHTAPRSGRLAALHVATGEQVAAGRVVAEIEAVAEAAPS